MMLDPTQDAISIACPHASLTLL
ncbi:hypothetical protein NPIL_601971, partial [Nephila pilipes]